MNARTGFLLVCSVVEENVLMVTMDLVCTMEDYIFCGFHGFIVLEENILMVAMALVWKYGG